MAKEVDWNSTIDGVKTGSRAVKKNYGTLENRNKYLQNPVIPAGNYFVKCKDVNEENGEIVAEFHVAPLTNYPTAGGKVLFWTIRNTPQAAELRKWFNETVEKDRFCEIEVRHSRYKNREYSSIHPIRQTEEGLCGQLYELDQAGKLKWTN